MMYIIIGSYKVDIGIIRVIDPTAFPLRIVGGGQLGEIATCPTIDSDCEHDEDQDSQ